MTFSEVRKLASITGIHVFNSFFEENPGVTVLFPINTDALDESGCCSAAFVIGDGSKCNLLTYRSAASVSPHYAILDLWFRFRRFGQVFIRANDWLLRVEPEGVTAEDGCFTKLLWL